MKTSRLLACGIVAGPLFVCASLVEALVRAGFDLGRHPISLLSLGDHGWIQIADFVVSGLLYLACAIGMARFLRSGRGSTWGPRLIGLIGIGLILAGVFTTDPGAGFPPGAPEGAPDYSWHGVLHEVGFAVTVVSWLAFCFVLRRRFAALGRRGWGTACIAVPVAVLVVVAWPGADSLGGRLLVAATVQFAFVTAVVVDLLRVGGSTASPVEPADTGRGDATQDLAQRG